MYLLGGTLNTTFVGANQSNRVIEHDLPNIFGFNSNPKILTYEGNRIISQINIELNDLIDEYNNINYIIKTNQDVDNILIITNS